MSKTWKQVLALANKAEGKFDRYRSELEGMASEFFDDEISCEYMMGDGFVICWEDTKSNCAPYVMSVNTFFFLAHKNGEVTERDFKTHSI